MEYCKNEACHDERKKDCLLINGKRVLSFFKVMIDESFLKVLYFPPKFARSLSHLKDQETYLEDSSGRQWRVTVCNHNDSLAIEQGWPTFSSEHGLKEGDFLVFHYVPSDQNFIVQIFGRSGCEKINFCSDIGKGKQKARTYPEASTLHQITSGASEYKKGQSAKYVDESLCMIDRNAQYDQEHDRLCLHLSSFEIPMGKSLAQGTSSRDNGKGKKRARTCLEAIPLLQITDNHVETKLSEPHLDVEIDSEALFPEFEAGTDMVSRPTDDIPLVGPKDDKSKEASQFDSGEEYANSEPADSGDTSSPNADKYSCLVVVDGRDFLEIPESWQQHLLKRAKKGRMIIFLRGPDKRIWPTFYHRRSDFNVLTCGWKQFTAGYGLNPGDKCRFQLVNRQERIFNVCKI